MKKLNKILISTIMLITLLILTNISISKAATYKIGNKNSNGTYTITVTFDTDSAKNKDFSDDGWTKTSEDSKSFSKDFKPGEYGGLSITTGSTTESIIVAAPYTLKVGEILDLSPTKDTTKIENLNLEDTSIAQVDGMKVTALKAGTTTLTATVTLGDITGSCTWNLTVEGTSDSGNGSGSSGSINGSGTSDSGNNSENGSGTWTDFSNAKFNLEKYNYSDCSLQISNISPIDSHSYKYLITTSSTEPSSTEAVNPLTLNNQTLTTYSIGEYVSLNQDIYLWVYETYNGNTKLVVNGEKLVKPEIPTYTNVFSESSHLSATGTTISLQYPFGNLDDQNRNINIKIGKITNSTILQNIYNKKDTSFADLLSYAKESEGIYSNTLKANTSTGYSDTSNSFPNFDSTKLDDGAYYFLYVELDDENGKYLPAESVTFAQASTSNSYWALFFYGSNDFKWVGMATDETTTSDTSSATTTDSTVATTNHPQTGENSIIIIAIIAIFGVAILFRVKSKKVIK